MVFGYADDRASVALEFVEKFWELAMLPIVEEAHEVVGYGRG